MSFLQLQDDIEVVGTAADGTEAVQLAEATTPDIVLLDVVMPTVDGVEALRRIAAAAPSSRVIILTTFGDDDRVFPAIEAGAAAYLLKDVRPQELVEAIRTVHAGESLLHPTVASKVMQEVARRERRAPEVASLTSRELDVLRVVAQGKSNREIARELGVSEKTVKTHVSNILGKLGLTDRTQAALYAVRNRLVEPES